MSRLTPEDLAQELIDQAWEAEDDVERVRLVLRALAEPIRSALTTRSA
jgi:hypothetical protein